MGKGDIHCSTLSQINLSLLSFSRGYTRAIIILKCDKVDPTCEPEL
jgi:hypothetical protein